MNKEFRGINEINTTDTNIMPTGSYPRIYKCSKEDNCKEQIKKPRGYDIPKNDISLDKII